MEKQMDDAYFAATAEQAKHEPATLDEKLEGSIVSSPEHDHDHIHDGLVIPTLEELETLRHIADKINWPTYRKSLPPHYTLNRTLSSLCCAAQ